MIRCCYLESQWSVRCWLALLWYSWLLWSQTSVNMMHGVVNAADNKGHHRRMMSKSNMKAILTRMGSLVPAGLGRIEWTTDDIPSDGFLQLSELSCECSPTCLMSEEPVQWVPTYGGGSSGPLYSGLGAWWLCERGCYNALQETAEEPTGYRFCYVPVPDNVDEAKVLETCREPFNIQRDPLTGFWMRLGC